MAHPPTEEPTLTTSLPSSDVDRRGMPAPAWAVRNGDGTWRVKWCPEASLMIGSASGSDVFMVQP
ncbi:hypothetical protein [Embleya sp. NPDC001921]